ncbi:hypothetical protein [Halocatena pleomorpha]|uniref:hypothetical protein n=1 Tax=Halocatena pleomorpha TaxID=1785090 RepID=UPI001C89B99E|nr:hypothetical protein [Halocatena pleomorpha]
MAIPPPPLNVGVLVREQLEPLEGDEDGPDAHDRCEQSRREDAPDERTGTVADEDSPEADKPERKEDGHFDVYEDVLRLAALAYTHEINSCKDDDADR